jgi:hypothetical protein
MTATPMNGHWLSHDLIGSIDGQDGAAAFLVEQSVTSDRGLEPVIDAA